MIEYAIDYVFYSRADEMLAECAKSEKKPDIYILDIEMPGLDGLAAAKEICRIDSKALIVFLTSYSKYMPDVFEVVTFDFIPKPITEDRLRLLFIKAETYLNMTLNEIWEKLDERSFAAVHGSLIVNLKHIKTFSGGVVILTDGTELTVSRGYRKQLAEKHITFVQGGM